LTPSGLGWLWPYRWNESETPISFTQCAGLLSRGGGRAKGFARWGVREGILAPEGPRGGWRAAVVTNRGTLNGTQYFYYSGQQLIEERDGSENVKRQ
jgi:hypothetical protein